MNDKGVCRTAQATPGLLKRQIPILRKLTHMSKEGQVYEEALPIQQASLKW